MIVYLMYFTRFRVQHIDTVIFRPYPDTSVVIFRQPSDSFGIQRMRVTSRHIFIKGQLTFGQVIGTAEHRTDPDSSFMISVDRINTVIGKAERTHQVLFEMSHLIFLLINDKDAVKRSYPDFIFKTHHIPQECLLLAKEGNIT